MKLIFFTSLILFMGVAPGYPVHWEYVTSDKTYDGIDISYFVDMDEIKTMNGIKKYREKRIYARGKAINNIGIVEITGYYDCVNASYVNGSISFLSPEGKYLEGYLFTGDDYRWRYIDSGTRRQMYNYVCTLKD